VRGVLERKCACGNHTIAGGECAECSREKINLQRKCTGGGELKEVPPIVHDVLQAPGQPLDSETRAFMEPRFNHDFSNVRVHTDGRAGESASAVKAMAYTVGRDVVFGAGRYSPRTDEGRRLLAHELTHVIQQNLGSGGKEQAAETEADLSTAKIEDGRSIQVAAPSTDSLQRAPDETDVEHDKIVGVNKRTTSYEPSKAWEIVWRMLTRYFPQYSDKVSAVGYEEKLPGVKIEISEREYQGKKIQSAVVTVGKRFVAGTSEDTLRERIMELGAHLEVSGLKPTPDPQASTGSSVVSKLLSEKFPKKGRRISKTYYDANLPGLLTEFKGIKFQIGKVTIERAAGPALYYGKAFLSMPDAAKESRMGAELEKIDKWSVENYQIVREDLEDEDIALRIRGLSSDKLREFRDNVADPAVKEFAESLLTTSTPIQGGLSRQPDGRLSVDVGNFTVVVEPDVLNDRKLTQPKTDYKIPSRAIKTPTFVGGKVKGFKPPPRLVITIQTRYPAAMGPDLPSDYGRGTTDRDRELGATTVRAHEGSHGLEFLKMIIDANAAHPYPADPELPDGTPVAESNRKMDAYTAEGNAFLREVANKRRASIQAVDCVGTTIDVYNQENKIKEIPICD
jgi:hypothetical protein